MPSVARAVVLPLTSTRLGLLKPMSKWPRSSCKIIHRCGGLAGGVTPQEGEAKESVKNTDHFAAIAPPVGQQLAAGWRAAACCGA